MRRPSQLKPRPRVRAEAELDKGGNRIALGVVPPRQVGEGLQVLAHQAVQEALLQPPGAVDPRMGIVRLAGRDAGKGLPQGR
jgi:hypothetical protein